MSARTCLETPRAASVALLILIVAVITASVIGCNDQARVVSRGAGDDASSGTDVSDAVGHTDGSPSSDISRTDATGNEPDPLCEGVACEGCYRGECYATCATSNDCADNERCANGACIPLDCDELTCGPTEVCLNGVCYAAIPCTDDVECGSGGACIDDNCTPAPSCDDGYPNGNESDVDCGGDCAPCANYRYCRSHGDCESGMCNGLCQPASCADSIKNGSETDIDCGGTCASAGKLCVNGDGCAADTDCESGACRQDMCVSLTCADGDQNGEETGVDCGGRLCAPCRAGDTCSQDSDCASLLCENGSCAPQSCSDNVRNGDETDIDCGGSCPLCANDSECAVDSDCQSGRCSTALGKCVLPQCDNHRRDGDETDIDCGGTGCPPCLDGDQCVGHDDCASQSCVNATCVLPSCRDFLTNGAETDSDCGGPACSGCADGKKCNGGQDCASGFCQAGLCTTPSCTDGVRNGAEIGRDCGGPCAACDGPDVQCTVASDCNTNLCVNGQCAICVEGDVQYAWRRCGYQQRGLQYQTCAGGTWVDSLCVGEWFASCSERQEAGRELGEVTIDPDGPYDGYRSFPVTCVSGGWTGINQCTALTDLRGRLVSVDNAARMFGYDQRCRPRTRDKSVHHTSHYTFRFPAGIDQFYLEDYQLRANASASKNDSSDISVNFHQTRWGAAYETVGDTAGKGDVSFGDGAAGGPITSFAKVRGQDWTGTHDVLDWPLDPLQGVYTLDYTTSFRIGWGEAGREWEGWYPWWKGTIYMRDRAPDANGHYCCALCGNRFRYHRVEGVTEDCNPAVHDYCSVGDRGAFVDAAWGACAP